jgi:hypothetical protein
VDVVEPNDDEHGVLGKLAHDLLLGWRVQAFVARLGERALVDALPTPQRAQT